MPSTTADLVFDARFQLGEGALWSSREGVLYGVDIVGKQFWRFNPADNSHELFDVGQLIGCIVPRRSGGVLLGLHRGIASYDLAARKLTMLCDPEGSRSDLRFNDGKCDPAGRFWAGTMPVSSSDPIGSLFCLSPDLRIERKLTGVCCSNGIVWSIDQKTMYYIDTGLMRVDAFDYEVATGAISNRRIAITLPTGMGLPDGSTLDAEGMLWIAHWGGARITRWDPRNDRHLQTIKLPASNITSCAFGGNNLDCLYVTTARVGLTMQQLASEPQAGGIFCLDVGVQGIPACEFAG